MSISPIIATLVSLLIWSAEEYWQEPIQVVDVPIVAAVEAVEPSKLYSCTWVGSVDDNIVSVYINNSAGEEFRLEDIDKSLGTAMAHEGIYFVPEITDIMEAVSSDRDYDIENLQKSEFYDLVLENARKKDADAYCQIFFEIDEGLPKDKQRELAVEGCKGLLTTGELQYLEEEAEQSAQEYVTEQRKQAEQSRKKYIKIANISFYDEEGNPLSTVDSVESLLDYTQSLDEKFKNDIINAKKLSGTVKASSIELDTLYKLTCLYELNIINDRDSILAVETLEWDTFDNEWDSDVQLLCAKTLSGDNDDWYQLGYFTPEAGRGAYHYIRFTEVKSIQTCLLDISNDCIKVSELNSEPYDVFSKEYLYNDMGSDVSISYVNKNTSESKTVNVPKGVLLGCSWMDYDDLTVID